MNKLNLLASFLLIGITGCAHMSSVPISEVPKTHVLQPQFLNPQADRVQVIVQRYSGLMNMACSTNFHVDGKAIINLNPGEMATLYITQGKHEFSVTSGMSCSQETAKIKSELVLGKNKTYSISAKFYGSIEIDDTSF